jgi:hypothetical protein
MKKITLFICLILLLFSSACSNKNLQPDLTKQVESMDDYAILASGDLYIKMGNQTTVLEINALPDSHIRQDERQRLLILSDPSDQYQHGIIGDVLEATSVTMVQLSDQPSVISKFSVPEGWVIESIRPIWSDWDGDGEREIVLTLSNSTVGAKLVLYDETGNILAESLPIGKGFRWRHTLDIAPFGESGQRLLVDVQTPHIGGIVSFYSWDKEKKVLTTEATLPGYSTHDIGSRAMQMYTLLLDEQNEQVLLILPSQSKTELAALRFVSGEIHEEWRIPLGGKLSGNLELIDENGVRAIRATIDNNREVSLNLPE